MSGWRAVWLGTGITLVMLSGGCKLVPKNVELFQRKVAAMPKEPPQLIEARRQAAGYVATKTEETVQAALRTDADKTVIEPAQQAHTVAEALADSLGPPREDWRGEAAALREALRAQEARLMAQMEKYRERTQEDVGKKIEGTGLVQMPYLVWLGLVLGALFLVWLALQIWSLFNPVVGLGTRVTNGLIQKALREVVSGGAAFREKVLTSDLDTVVKARIEELFLQAQKEAQSADSRQVVRALLGK